MQEVLLIYVFVCKDTFKHDVDMSLKIRYNVFIYSEIMHLKKGTGGLLEQLSQLKRIRTSWG